MIRTQNIAGMFFALVAVLVIGVAWQVNHQMGFNPLVPEWWVWLGKYRYQEGFFPPELLAAIYTALPVWVVVVLVLGMIGGWVMTRKKNEYGEARYARKRDLKNMGLTAKKGVVLGVAFKKLLAFDKWLSACVFAAPGSGKSEGVIKPSIFNAGDKCSIVVHDLSGELYNETGGCRATVGPCFKLSWGDSQTAKWNPLQETELPDDNANLQTYVDNIWQLLIPRTPGADSHFDERGRQLGVAATLFNIFEAREQGKSTTFEEIFYWIAEGVGDTDAGDTDDPVGMFLTEKAVIAEHKNMPRVVVGTFKSMAMAQFKERSGYISSYERGLSLWQNEHVCNATSNSDFSVKDFRGIDGKPISVYIAIPDKEVETFAAITRIFLSILVGEINSITKEEVADKMGVTFLLDEAPRLGYMPKVVLQGPALSRKCHANYVIVGQDPGQFREVYGADGLSTINTVYQYKVIYFQINRDVQKELADIIGQETRVKKSYSLNESMKQAGGSQSLEGHYLIRPEVFGSLKQYHSLVLAPNHYSTPLKAQGAFSPSIGKFKKFTKMKAPETFVTGI